MIPWEEMGSGSEVNQFSITIGNDKPQPSDGLALQDNITRHKMSIRAIGEQLCHDGGIQTVCIFSLRMNGSGVPMGVSTND
jgi:hypothetical protein